MKKRVLLTAIDTAGTFALDEVGIVSLASVLRERGHEVKVLQVRQGIIEKEEEVIAFQPDLFGISIYNRTKNVCLALCRRIKDLVPTVTVCAGGYLPTYYSEELIEETDCVDVAVRGEGEITLTQLVESLGDIRRVPGITYRASGKAIRNCDQPEIVDLDSIPFPVLDDLHRLRAGRGMTYVCSSRGCLSHCTFCISPRFSRVRWRGCSADKVVEGLSMLQRQYGRTVFGFTDNTYDDAFGDTGHERIRRIAEGILERGLNVSYYVNFTPGFYRNAPPGLVDLLLRSGMTLVYLGIEAGNAADLKIYGKGLSVEDNSKALDYFRQFDMNPSIGFIGLNPWSTLDRLRENLTFLSRHGYASQFCFANKLILYRGTPLLMMAERDGLLRPSSSYEVHNYAFVDDSVASLSGFLEKKFQPLRVKHRLGYHLSHLFETFRSKISYYRRSQDLRVGALAEKLVAAEREIEISIDELNCRNTVFFSKLLDLAESGWREAEAEAIASQHLDPLFLFRRVNAMYAAKDDVDAELLAAGVSDSMVA